MDVDVDGGWWMCVCVGVQYKLLEPLSTMDGDYIGFTNEGNVGAISFSYTAEGRTLFVGRDAEAMPRIGDVFVFNNQLQANYSIAVQLSTGPSLRPSVRPSVCLSVRHSFTHSFTFILAALTLCTFLDCRRDDVCCVYRAAIAVCACEIERLVANCVRHLPRVYCRPLPR